MVLEKVMQQRFTKNVDNQQKFQIILEVNKVLQSIDQASWLNEEMKVVEGVKENSKTLFKIYKQITKINK